MANTRDFERPFSITVVINYEDTDAGGVVYYGNYLGYMERVRNACFRYHGFPLRILEEEYRLLFVVTGARLQFSFPARLDDELKVNMRVKEICGARIQFKHEVLKDESCIVQGDVDIAMVNSQTFKPRRIPLQLKNHLTEHMVTIE